MGLGFTRTNTTGDIPFLQGSGGDIQLAQGGFSLDMTGLTAGAIIKGGTPVKYDEATRRVTVLSASSYTGVNGLLYADTVANLDEPCSVIIRGTVYARRVPYSAGLATAMATGAPHIIYSQSF